MGYGGLCFALTLCVFFPAVSTTTMGVNSLTTNPLCPRGHGDPPVL